MYARCPASPSSTGSDSSGYPASTHARQTRLSRWSDGSDRYRLRRTVTRDVPTVRRVELPLEAVPNFSEGRDRSTLEAIEAALAAHVRVLDVHVDADHHRSVFTVVGSDAALEEALLAAVGAAI